MWTAEIISPWATDDTGNVIQLSVDYAGIGRTFEDVTDTPGASIPPAPNLCVVRALVDGATLDAIEADDTYLVMWSVEDA